MRLVRLGLVLALGAATACGDDDGADDAVPQDASVDARTAATDARTQEMLDANGDAQAKDAGPACMLDGPLRYFQQGGRTPLQSVYMVSADGTFRRESRNESDPDAGVACSAPLSACGSSDVDLGDLNAALSAASASFTSDMSVVLGSDKRPVDGTVLIVVRSDNKLVTVGDSCASDPGCTPIPDSVATLKEVLSALSTQMAAMGPCKR